ncbi:MAG TPA: glycosyl hydrolase family 28 protein [Candidatus Acidoferrales bacterium]|nr:glycosyl hydrolase family 28 protein [Candidatus Acidoferrales bacterium]
MKFRSIFKGIAGFAVGVCLVSQLKAAGPEVFSITNFGASGDGKTVNTEAIQKTIDAAAKNGGVVEVPAGIFLTGAVFLKSKVELHLEAGATLRAVTNETAYPLVQTRIAGIEMPWPAAVVNVMGQHDVKVTGAGTIDGDGSYWWHKFWGEDYKSGMLGDYTARGLRWAVDYDCQRVRALVFYDSKDVEVKGITIARSGFWSLTFTYCERAHVDGLIVDANRGGHGPSSDGIDIDSSRDILVENCDIDCNDDDICLKAGRDADGLRVNRPTEKIVIRNCITRGGQGMFTIGSETSGGIHDVEVSGIQAIGTTSGVRFKSSGQRGGVVSNIRIHDIQMTNVATPFEFNLDWYRAYSVPTLPPEYTSDKIPVHWKTLMEPVVPAERGVPEFTDVHFSNITVAGAKTAILANAFKAKPLLGFTWTNVVIEAGTAGKINNATDWGMNKLVIRATDHKPMKLSGVVNVPMPD